MYLEFVVGPVLSLLIALKFGNMKDKEREQQITALQEKVELLEKSTSTLESELPKKVMATMLPVAKAVQKLNQQVGL
jgi:uncharacterized membrane protein YgaE (UPF0421/DUF939 family)